MNSAIAYTAWTVRIVTTIP